MEKKDRKLFGRLNIIDFLVMILAVLVLAFVGYKLATRGNADAAENRVAITYTVKCKGVEASLYDAVQPYLPSSVMAAGVRQDVQVTGVTQEPYFELNGGKMVPDTTRVNLIFTFKGTVANNAVLTNEVGSQEVRIGKADYIVKSEYFEFTGGIVTSVTWVKP